MLFWCLQIGSVSTQSKRKSAANDERKKLRPPAEAGTGVAMPRHENPAPAKMEPGRGEQPGTESRKMLDRFEVADDPRQGATGSVG